MEQRSGLIRNLLALYACGKKGFEGVVKIRQGVVNHDPGLGFNGVLDLVGSAGIALLLTPEGMVAGAALSLGSSVVQNVKDFRNADSLPTAQKIDFALKAGLSIGAFLFFVPGGFLPGTALVGGISAARQVLKARRMLPGANTATGG